MCRSLLDRVMAGHYVKWSLYISNDLNGVFMELKLAARVLIGAVD